MELYIWKDEMPQRGNRNYWIYKLKTKEKDGRNVIIRNKELVVELETFAPMAKFSFAQTLHLAIASVQKHHLD